MTNLYESELDGAYKEIYEAYLAGMKKEKPKIPAKTWLMIYGAETGEIVIERLNLDEIQQRIQLHSLEDGDYAIIDGNVVKGL